MFTSLRYKLERRIGEAMPPLLYCWLDEKLRTLNPSRRGGRKRRTGKDQTGLYVEWEGGERFYFNHHLLHNRYVWPNGLDFVRGVLLEKYQDGEVSIRPGDTIIEAGANVGEFTTAAAAVAGTIHAFDPDPMTFGCLSKNAQSFKNIRLHHAGLGDFEGEAELHISRGNSDSSFIPPEETGEGLRVRVPVTTIEALMEREGLAKVDFLKVEAEGFEPEILAGAGKRLRDISKVAVDCGPERYGADTYAECEAPLKAAGFRTWRRTSDWMLFAVNN